MNDRTYFCVTCEQEVHESNAEDHKHLNPDLVNDTVYFLCDLCHRSRVGTTRAELDNHFRRVHLLPSPTPTR